MSPFSDCNHASLHMSWSPVSDCNWASLHTRYLYLQCQTATEQVYSQDVLISSVRLKQNSLPMRCLHCQTPARAAYPSDASSVRPQQRWHTHKTSTVSDCKQAILPARCPDLQHQITAEPAYPWDAWGVRLENWQSILTKEASLNQAFHSVAETLEEIDAHAMTWQRCNKIWQNSSSISITHSSHTDKKCEKTLCVTFQGHAIMHPLQKWHNVQLNRKNWVYFYWVNTATPKVTNGCPFLIRHRHSKHSQITLTILTISIAFSTPVSWHQHHTLYLVSQCSPEKIVHSLKAISFEVMGVEFVGMTLQQNTRQNWGGIHWVDSVQYLESRHFEHLTAGRKMEECPLLLSQEGG